VPFISFPYAFCMQQLDPQKEKLAYWAKNPKVARLPRIGNMPTLTSMKFDSHEAFNQWKLSIQLELIRRGGVKWIP
jgi:hypothetical protein